MILKPLQKQYTYISEYGAIQSEITSCYTVLNSAIKEYCKDYVGGAYLEIGVNYGHSAYCAWQSFQPNFMMLCDIFPEKNMVPIIERTLNVIGCKSIVTFVYGDTKKTLRHIKHRFDDFDVLKNRRNFLRKQYHYCSGQLQYGRFLRLQCFPNRLHLLCPNQPDF